MKGQALAVMAMRTCVPTLASVCAQADPRDIGEPPPPLTPELIAARREKLAADMADWLPRLVGRFRIDGVADFTGSGLEDPVEVASGKADCVAIGKGPGVHCLFHVSWIPQWTPEGLPVDGGVPFLAPAMKLFGLEPNAPLIHQLQLDTDGVAELESTILKGNTVRWIYETRCESDTHADARCRRITRFHASEGSSRVQLVIEFEKWNPEEADWDQKSNISLDMLRESEQQVSGVSRNPAAQDLR
jgi:hypothetical protein